MTETQEQIVPVLRFPDFAGEWDSLKLGDIAEFSKGKGIPKADIDENGTLECIRYGQLYTDYAETIREVVSRTNVPANDLVLSEANDIIIPASGETQIDIATASCVLRCGIALGGDLNIVKTKHDGVFLSYYLNSTRKYDIARLSQGISVVHLYPAHLKLLHLNLPDATEQQKIASFLSSVDGKIEQVGKKKALLEQYKKGMMQKLFSQELRFKDAQGNDFPDWEEKRLGDVLFEHKNTNKDDAVSEVFSVAKHKGVINQIEHLGRSYAASSISHYKVASPFDVIYTKSPTSDFPFGIIKQNLTGRSGVVSPLYAVLKPVNKYIGFMLHNYFASWVNTYNYLNPLVQKGAKNTMSIRNDDFLNGARIGFPTSTKEQQKIADFLSSIDRKIDLVATELDNAKAFKKGLLQQMFV